MPGHKGTWHSQSGRKAGREDISSIFHPGKEGRGTYLGACLGLVASMSIEPELGQVVSVEGVGWR